MPARPQKTVLDLSELDFMDSSGLGLILGRARIAKEKNIVDNPDARKLNKVPIPVLGGVGVFFGMLVAMTIGIVVVPFFFVWIYRIKSKIKAKRKR